MPIHQPNKQIEELQQKVLLLEKENRKLHIKNQERINTEKALKESVEKHKLLFESLGDGIAYYDLSGRVILINEKGARNLGGIPADFVDKSLRDFLDHEMADLLLERLDRTITSGKSTEQYDYLELPPGGMYLSSTFHPVRDAGNKIIGVQIISKDVSQQKLAEEELLKSEQRFQYAMEATQDGLYDWNLVTNEIYYSPGWKRMLGYEVDELPDDFSV
ncbi:MAG: PAS domain S-box protein, partial [Chloroflexi bacterium]